MRLPVRCHCNTRQHSMGAKKRAIVFWWCLVKLFGRWPSDPLRWYRTHTNRKRLQTHQQTSTQNVARWTISTPETALGATHSRNPSFDKYIFNMTPKINGFLTYPLPRISVHIQPCSTQPHQFIVTEICTSLLLGRWISFLGGRHQLHTTLSRPRLPFYLHAEVEFYSSHDQFLCTHATLRSSEVQDEGATVWTNRLEQQHWRLSTRTC